MTQYRLLFVILAVLLLGAACNGTDPGSAESPANRTLAFVTNNSADFWTIARRGVEAAESELDNVTVEFRITSDGSAAEQQRIVDDLLTSGVRGIAISPVDPVNQTPMINAAAGSALIFTQDSDAPASDRASYVGTDNVAAGRQAGVLIREALPDGGEIMLFVGKLDAANAQERIQGIEESLAGSDIEILDVRTDDTDAARAKSNAADAIVRYPDIAALVGLWSYNGPAILSAVQDAGRVGDIRIVAFDEADETLAGIRDGAIHATVVQQPYEFGYQAITLMARALDGDTSFIPADKRIIIPTLVVNADNVEEFSRTIDELRGR